jgi:hypothetical protein
MKLRYASIRAPYADNRTTALLGASTELLENTLRVPAIFTNGRTASIV